MSVVESTIIEANSEFDLGASDRVIASYRLRLAELDPEKPGEYEAAKAGLRELVQLRTGVEKARKEMKAGALEFGRKVDAEAKRVTALILDIEEPLKQKKLAVDKAVELAKQAERERREAEARAAAEAEEKKRREREEAERKRIEAEQAAERERLAKQQAAIDAERKKLQAERDAIEAERQKVIAEQNAAKEAAERAERERLAKIEAEERAKREEAERIAAEKQAELDRIEAEKQAEAERKAAEERAKAEAAEAARLAEERKPDVEKLRDVVKTLGAVKLPECKTDWGIEIAHSVNRELNSISERIQQEITQI